MPDVDETDLERDPFGDEDHLTEGQLLGRNLGFLEHKHVITSSDLENTRVPYGMNDRSWQVPVFGSVPTQLYNPGKNDTEMPKVPI